MTSLNEKQKRMAQIVKFLKKAYKEPKSELTYTQPHEFLFAVMLSAQCTDKRVNMVTPAFFKKHPTLQHYAKATREELRKGIASISFPNNKAQHIKETAQKILKEFDGVVPKEMEQLLSLKGVARKTANVVRGELFDEWDGIAIDTHVKRFARKFDLSNAATADGMEKDLMTLVPKKDWKYVNNGFVLYGRYLCTAIPHDCSQHPLTKLWPPAGSRWPKTK